MAVLGICPGRPVSRRSGGTGGALAAAGTIPLPGQPCLGPGRAAAPSPRGTLRAMASGSEAGGCPSSPVPVPSLLRAGHGGTAGTARAGARPREPGKGCGSGLVPNPRFPGAAAPSWAQLVARGRRQPCRMQDIAAAFPLRIPPGRAAAGPGHPEQRPHGFFLLLIDPHGVYLHGGCLAAH